MQGTVTDINPAAGMVAVEVDTNCHTIIEMLDDRDMAIGDRIRWADDADLGDCQFRNITQNTLFDGIIQNQEVTSARLAEQLLRRS